MGLSASLHIPPILETHSKRWGSNGRLSVTFSFLVVGSFGLGLIFGLLGLKATVIYLVLGFTIAISPHDTSGDTAGYGPKPMRLADEQHPTSEHVFHDISGRLRLDGLPNRNGEG